MEPWHLSSSGTVTSLSHKSVSPFNTTAASGQPEKGSVLYVGQSFYHAWYLSRELRKIGWKADVLNIDVDDRFQIFYHGQDFRFRYNGVVDLLRQLKFYVKSIFDYDIFHFSNAYGITYGKYVHALGKAYSEYSEIEILRRLGKKVVYSTNGCPDGASQTSMSKWGPERPCAICKWQEVPSVCSDEKNLAWGKARNRLADYVVTFDHNPADYNLEPRVHIVPEFFCLDDTFWNPDLLVPSNYRLPFPEETVKIYHSVGNFESRSSALHRNMKCTHIYLPLIERLKREGHDVELMFFTDVPNTKLRYYQAQADIVVDMLTFGWFGANVREAMMLGKPAVCFLRPEWLKHVAQQLPEYVRDLPVVSATPQNIHDVLKDLVESPEKRLEIGKRSRDFAVKWHSAKAAAIRFDRIYSGFLGRR